MKRILMILIVAVFACCSLFADFITPYRTEGDYRTLSDNETRRMVGDEYDNGYCADDYYYNGVFLYNLRNKYKVLSCIIGPNDNTRIGNQVWFRFTVDNEKVAEYTLKGGDFPIEMEVDLNYGRQLKLEFGGNEAMITEMDFK